MAVKSKCFQNEAIGTDPETDLFAIHDITISRKSCVIHMQILMPMQIMQCV